MYSGFLYVREMMIQTQIDRDNIKKVVSFLGCSRRILFITGAGISADSGLPTYRGISGLYSNKYTDEGLSIEQALSGEVLQKNPALTWKYLGQIIQACRNATFNLAHQIIAQMENHFDQVWVLTQNIDGFHRAAGSTRVIDIHGDVHTLLCTRCDYRCQVKDFSWLQELPPRCPECKGIVRPNVVLFGEMLPEDKYNLLYQQLQKGFDLIFTIGTSSVFPYISAPIIDAARNGNPTVEINPVQTEVSTYVTVKFEDRATVVLDAIWTEYLKTINQ
jgi:NAD-dependent deacetylase